MWTIILVLVATTAVICIALQIVYARAGNDDIKARFVERTDYIPSELTRWATLSAHNLQRWLSDPLKEGVRATYTFPVLFPLDYAFLIALGLLLGFTSVAISAQLTFLRKIPTWTWWAFPTIYMVCDFLEDSILVGLFSAKLNLSGHLYRLLRLLTKAKIATVSIALSQTGFLLALWGLLRLYRPES
jgi:hypothetical protein